MKALVGYAHACNTSWFIKKCVLFISNKIHSASPLLPPGLEPAPFIKQTEGRRPNPSCPLIYKGHTGRPREQRSHPPPTAHLAHFTVLWGCKHNRLYSLPIILHTGVWAEFMKLATILKVVHCGIVGSSNISVACFMHSILRMMRNESMVEQIHFQLRCLR